VGFPPKPVVAYSFKVPTITLIERGISGEIKKAPLLFQKGTFFSVISNPWNLLETHQAVWVIVVSKHLFYPY